MRCEPDRIEIVNRVVGLATHERRKQRDTSVPHGLCRTSCVPGGRRQRKEGAALRYGVQGRGARGKIGEGPGQGNVSVPIFGFSSHHGEERRDALRTCKEEKEGELPYDAVSTVSACA